MHAVLRTVPRCSSKTLFGLLPMPQRGVLLPISHSPSHSHSCATANWPSVRRRQPYQPRHDPCRTARHPRWHHSDGGNAVQSRFPCFVMWVSKGEQYKTRGSVITFVQDIAPLCSTLPHLPKDLDGRIVRKDSTTERDTYRDLP